MKKSTKLQKEMALKTVRELEQLGVVNEYTDDVTGVTRVAVDTCFGYEAATKIARKHLKRRMEEIQILADNSHPWYVLAAEEYWYLYDVKPKTEYPLTKVWVFSRKNAGSKTNKVTS